MDGLAEIRTTLDKLRHEFKSDIKAVNSTIKEIEQSLTFTQGEVETLKEQFKTESEEQKFEIGLLKERISVLEQSLKEEEWNTNLEQYTRRENLRFKNIKESEDEDCKEVVHNIIKRDLGIVASKIRFHAVQRIGKRDGNGSRPIIARFVCCEDWVQVWSKRVKLKKYKAHKDAYRRLHKGHPKGTGNLNQGNDEGSQRTQFVRGSSQRLIFVR